MKRTGWRELGAGSDAALLIWAPTIIDLFIAGARSLYMFALEMDDQERDPREGPEIRLVAPDSIELFLIWMNELNYRLQVNNWISWTPVFSYMSDNNLICRLNGFRRNNRTDLFQHEIKAVTRHRPFLNKGTDGTWVARVTLDL